MSILQRLFRPSNGTAAADAANDRETAAPAADRHRPAAAIDMLAGADQGGWLRAAEYAAPAAQEAEKWFAQALDLYQSGRYGEALDIGRRAAHAGMADLRLFLCLGWSHMNTGKPADAEPWMRKAVGADPGGWAPYAGLGAALQAQSRYKEAASSYERALGLNPSSADSAISLARCRIKEGDNAGAEMEFRRAIALEPGKARARIDLGVLLASTDRHGEALETLEHAVSIAGTGEEGVDALVDFAINLREAGRTQEALAEYARRLQGQTHVFGHFSYGVALLTAGRLAEGWPLYEFRWLTERFLATRSGFPQRPVWSGQDLRGKTILLRSEQGLGDTMQFVRYAPLVKALGATVHLKVHRGLEDVVRGLEGVDRIFDRDELPTEFDYYIHLASLPHVFGTELESIPAAFPYLHPAADRMQRWAGKLAGTAGLRIGLVWAGNPEHQVDRLRSIPLRTLLPLFGIDDAQFYSLQKGPAAEQLNTVPRIENLTDLASELADFGDTAAAISCLDLVICVDTAVAHLAGALGKPIWLLVPTPADWRWLEHRDDSPWYPTMRLFRQHQRGQWGDVVERVRAALHEGLEFGAGRAVSRVAGQRANQLAAVPTGLTAATKPAKLRPGLCAVVETRAGIMQYVPDRSEVADSIYWYNEYLQQRLDVITSLVTPGTVVLEIGAGVGMHALALARAVGAEGHLYLCETNLKAQTILRQNLDANRLSNFTILKQRIGGTLDGTPGSQDEVSRNRSATRASAGPEAQTIDDIQFERLGWLKINEADSAMPILAGASETLWRLRPFLLVAVADDAGLERTTALLREFSYRCWRMDTPLFNPGNFSMREDDIFAGRRAIALLAIPEEIDVDVPLDGCTELS